MKTHLEDVAELVTTDAHAVLMIDPAAWHTTEKPEVPENITLLPLPPRSPELNPMENIWQFMGNNWLSNLTFDSVEHIMTTCCDAWNELIAQPQTITSVGMRKWAHEF